MFADAALETVGLFDCFLDLHRVLFFVSSQVFLEKETLQLGQNTLHAIGWTPASPFLIPVEILLKHIQTNEISKDIWVREIVEESNRRRMVGVTHREFHLKMENTTLVESSFRSSDVSVPGEEVIFQWSGSDTHCGYLFPFDFFKVLDESFVWEGLQFFVDNSPEECCVGLPACLFHNI